MIKFDFLYDRYGLSAQTTKQRCMCVCTLVCFRLKLFLSCYTDSWRNWKTKSTKLVPCRKLEVEDR